MPGKFYDAYGMLEWDRLEFSPYGRLQALSTQTSSNAMYAEAIEFSMQVAVRVGSLLPQLRLAQPLLPWTYRRDNSILRRRK